LFSLNIVCFFSEETVIRNVRRLYNESERFPPLTIFVNGCTRRDKLEELEKVVPDCEILFSDRNLGPGGARDRLMREAGLEYCLMCDDDSYPVTSGWVDAICADIERFSYPDLIAYPVYEYGVRTQVGNDGADVSGFNCTCALIRRSAYAQVAGFSSLANAYGMEEEDLSLQFLEMSMKMIASDSVDFLHEADIGKHEDPARVMATVANQLILAFLRYPALVLPVGLYKALSKAAYNVSCGRTKGNAAGILEGFRWILVNRRRREPVSLATFWKKYGRRWRFDSI